MTTAMVLCAGYGTRLRPLSDELPKPLVPIGDRPLLAHVLERLKAAGVERAVLNLHHGADVFEKYIEALPLPVKVVHEPVLKGTAGGVAGARAWLGPPPVIVHTGDILTEPPVAELCQALGDGLCLAVRRRAIGEGPVGLDARGHIVRLRGRVFGDERFGADYIGVAALGARCLGTLPDTGCLIGDWALDELARGGVIPSVTTSASFSDVGELESYLNTNLAWLAGRSHYLAASAQVAPGVSLEASIVGEGARVVGSGSLRRSVIWPHATARAPLEHAVVMASGRVVALKP